MKQDKHVKETASWIQCTDERFQPPQDTALRPSGEVWTCWVCRTRALSTESNNCKLEPRALDRTEQVLQISHELNKHLFSPTDRPFLNSEIALAETDSWTVAWMEPNCWALWIYRHQLLLRGRYQNSFLPMSLVFVVRSRSLHSHWSAMVPGDWETKEVDQSVTSPRTWPGKSFGISLVPVGSNTQTSPSETPVDTVTTSTTEMARYQEELWNPKSFWSSTWIDLVLDKKSSFCHKVPNWLTQFHAQIQHFTQASK